MTRSTGAAGKNGEGLPLSNVASSAASESGDDLAPSCLEPNSNSQDSVSQYGASQYGASQDSVSQYSLSQYSADKNASIGRGNETGANETGAGRRIGLRALTRTEFRPAAELAARGMIDDPILVQVFGPNPKKRLRRLAHYYAYGMRFIHSNGDLLGAFEREILVGVIGATRPGFCQPRPLDALRIVPMMVKHNSPAISLRLKRWVDGWGRHDPREDHWHIGLLAVEPRVRGLGVGTRLMVEHCARVDEARTVSYLETDSAINVRFYEKFGYRIAGQARVLGVASWFMKRLAGGEG
jgi:RimJ/RimL family protein N-acetyltransferase